MEKFTRETIALNPVCRPKNGQQFMAPRANYKMQLRMKAIEERERSKSNDQAKAL